MNKITKNLLGDIRHLIESTKARVSQVVNSELVLLYWSVGKRVRKDILKEKRANYGEEIVFTVSKQLSQEYGSGYSRQGIFHMIKFNEMFPDPKIVLTLSGQLGWSHFIEILTIDDPLSRNFYAQMCRIERWSVRILREKIGSLLRFLRNCDDERRMRVLTPYYFTEPAPASKFFLVL